ncbi:hypothetical protein LX77_01753 [Gelidibacter algens]|uniref:Uncharacterized protein n=1 Tax=Gelidibacter algens TaxID=49280 RepID=A0A327SG94_9FLAO|nr:hypothetical protein [Gelidibacter algens]RAJ24757.1 hypothetical protein LX77_01753 [Gelidibacter algens]
MFATFLKTRTYIAVVLTFIFLAKFVAIDAHGLKTLFSATDTVFVNPYCKKQATVDATETSQNFSQQDHHQEQLIILSGQCTTPFHLELFTWEINYSDPIAVLDDHVPSRLNYRYLESVSPPPRLV